MGDREFSPLRSKSARKPWPDCPDVVIFRCSSCGRLYQMLDYEKPNQELLCCKKPMKHLEPQNVNDVSTTINIDYRIVGGHNQNAVQVFWEIEEPENHPQWVLLKTFTGGYIKYVTTKVRPPLVFPLADEDAYVYCDEDPCLQCVFRCKRGFIIFVYIKTKGLFAVPLDKMSAQY